MHGRSVIAALWATSFWLIALAIGAYSTYVNGAYGWTFWSGQAALFAVGFVLVDVAKFVMSGEIGRRWRSAPASTLLVILPFVIGASLLSIVASVSVGIQGQERQVSATQSTDAIRQSLRDERERLLAEMSRLGDTVPVQAAQAAVEALRADRWWRYTKECKRTRGNQTRAFCARYAEAEARLASSRRAVEIRPALAAVDQRLRSLEGRTVQRSARRAIDVAANYLKVPADWVALALVAAVAVAVELAGIIAWMVASTYNIWLPGHRPEAKPPRSSSGGGGQLKADDVPAEPDDLGKLFDESMRDHPALDPPSESEIRAPESYPSPEESREILAPESQQESHEIRVPIREESHPTPTQERPATEIEDVRDVPEQVRPFIRLAAECANPARFAGGRRARLALVDGSATVPANGPPTVPANRPPTVPANYPPTIPARSMHVQGPFSNDVGSSRKNKAATVSRTIVKPSHDQHKESPPTIPPTVPANCPSTIPAGDSLVDALDAFLSRAICAADGAVVSATDVYAAYLKVCNNKGSTPESQAKVGRLIKSRYPGAKKRKKRGLIVYEGIDLRA